MDIQAKLSDIEEAIKFLLAESALKHEVENDSSVNYDVNTLIDELNELTSLKDALKQIALIRKEILKQDKIVEHIDEQMQKMKGYSFSGRITIKNHGQYYVVSSDGCDNNEDFRKTLTISSVYSREGQAVLAFDGSLQHIAPLDEINFLAIPKSNAEDQSIKHYRIGRGLINTWGNSNESWAIKSAELEEKGIIIISDNGKEFLYNYKTGKVLTYGFTSILPQEEPDNGGANYVSTYDCCKAVLVINSNHTNDSNYPIIIHTLIGYVDFSGTLIDGMLDINDGVKYACAKGEEHTIEMGVFEKLRKAADDIVKQQTLVVENSTVMLKELESHKNNKNADHQN